jgi:DNA-binding MarR family transcriptional regulator
MARLDAERLAAWTDTRAMVERVARAIDAELQAEWAVPLAWFDVLARLRALGGKARPQDLAEALGIPRATLSRRLDRLAEEGWVQRHHGVDPDDHRAVLVELTARGRTLWREMNVTYRRAVNRNLPVRGQSA